MRSKLFADSAWQLWWRLATTRRAISKARDKEVRPYGISAPQAAVLFVAQANGDRTTPGVISDWLLLEPHTVSGILRRMENLGLIRKVRDLDRKNMVRVTLTEKGKQAYRNSSRIKSIRNIMSTLTHEQRSQLASFLETLQGKALEELGNVRKPPYP